MKLLIASAQKCGGYSFNWTKVELKHRCLGKESDWFFSFNWTKVELKQGKSHACDVKEHSFNWTKVELKPVYTPGEMYWYMSFNWTKVELKPGGADLSVITGGLLIELR